MTFSAVLASHLPNILNHGITCGGARAREKFIDTLLHFPALHPTIYALISHSRARGLKYRAVALN